MAWTDSRIFQQAMLNPITASAWSTTEPTTYGAGGLSADTVNCALFGSAVTPDRAAVVGSTGYNTGTWTTGNESSGTGYTAGGSALASKAFAIDAGSSSVCFTAANVSWTTVTVTASGDFVYDSTITAGTVAKQGLCYNYFGGSQSVTAGTFTIQWATPGGAAVTAVFNVTV